MAPVKRPFRVRRRTYFREWREAVVPLLSRNSPNRSIPPIFLGSKADATFCLAMISIRSGMKPRGSQRHRNNCFLSRETGTGPANFQLSPQPPTMLCPGAGGWQAISRPQIKPQSYIVSCKNNSILTLDPPAMAIGSAPG